MEAEPAPTVGWLLDGDAAIAWQALSDLAGATAEAVERKRSRVAREGWGAMLLAMQLPNGEWPAPEGIPVRWRSTLEAMVLLWQMGVDPASEEVRHAMDRVRDNVTWGPEFGDSPWFEGEVEPCINGRVLALGAYFGLESESLLQRLLGEQLEDGGWNCEAPPSVRASFHTTLCVLEGLLAWEQAIGTSSKVTEARQRGERYLVDRGLLRSKRSWEWINPDWAKFAFPTDWHFDVLWGLDYLRRAGWPPDERLAEAVSVVREAREPDGRWRKRRVHDQDLRFVMEGDPNSPSRWVTLRALRVLAWADREARPS